MIMLKFNVRNQQLSRVDSFKPVEKSLNYLTASFQFLTPDWEGTVKRVVCKNTKEAKPYDAAITDNTCLIPWEAIGENGSFEISLKGTTADGTVIPTSVVTVDLGETLVSAAETNPPSPGEVELIQSELASLNGRVKTLEQGGGTSGENGATFTPEVDSDGNLSWTNDKGLKNPETVNIKGTQGEKGEPFTYADFTEEQLAALTGPQGPAGADYVLTDADKTKIAEQAAKLVAVPDAYKLPVGGDELGGVKNGGNVTINADGTMTAPESSGGIAVTGATVGQTVVIAAVDENGVPTAWEPVDFPSNDYEYIKTITIEEAEVISCEIDLGAEYKSILLSTFTKTGKASQAMLTGGNMYVQANNGDTNLLDALVTITFSASRQYVITIEDMGTIMEIGAVQSLSSGGQNTSSKTLIRKPKYSYNTDCPNKVKLTRKNSDAYFTQGLEIDVFGVRV